MSVIMEIVAWPKHSKKTVFGWSALASIAVFVKRFRLLGKVV